MRLPGTLLLALLLILAVHPAAQASAEKRVLLLHSYHAGMKWVERIHQTARQELQALQPEALVYTEYMDTKRVPLLPGV
ncbi:MAG: hypothetical protein AB2814_11160 [Candidatus Sedimenticola endophacoides]